MATIEYQPRGRGFEVRLAAGSLELVVRGTGLHHGDPEVCGSSELTGNVALVALVFGYAANELAYRRSRPPEKRMSHREAAGVERKDVLGLADLVVRLDERTVSAWCSGCFTKTTRRPGERFQSAQPERPSVRNPVAFRLPSVVKTAGSALWSVRRRLSPSRSFVRWGAPP